MYITLDPIYFLHIPKTAGSTVRVWLRDIVGEGEYLEADALSNPRVLKEKWRLYLGHFGWALPELCQNISVVTFLRAPQSLYRSLFDFASTLDYATLPVHFKLFEHSLQLAKIVETDGLARTLSSDYFQHFFSNFLVRNITSGIDQLDRRPRKLSQSDLNLAKGRLQSMPFVGLAEEMEWSAALFSDAFRLPLRPLIMRLNKSARQSEVPRDWKDAVAEANPLDNKLYEFSRRLFEARRRHLLNRNRSPASTNASDLEPFLRASFLSQDRGICRFSSLKVDASSDVMVTGFHVRFCHRGRWLRWSGPGVVSRIYLPLDPTSDRVVNFDIIYARSEAIRIGLKIAVNGTPIDFRIIVRNDNGGLITTYRCSIPRALLNTETQYAEVEILAPESIAIPGINLGDDMINRGAFALGFIEVN
jgi:hypothetical protein